MALTIRQLSVLAAAFIYLSAFCCKIGMADDFTSERGDVPDQIGSAEQDPAQIVAKALLCFNDKYVYSSCEESYRLNEVEISKCQQQKLTSTATATVQDVRDTIQAACGYGEERGKFDVAEHIKAEGSKAYKAANYQILIGLVAMIMGNGLLF
ncbi:uncharacterized protein Pyn_10153 [Prunus yedoensis var. nudiflora]|uniref:DUF7731 domain-containing protein n=1 Tax=Prunus yedoensis var. nudiflora TaxID=2094558 RepID=A0A314XGU4_PRUYE|nr:uncharacterized protein Pyn_10153 [Prunus yedoensis var. nudiflora]